MSCLPICQSVVAILCPVPLYFIMFLYLRITQLYLCECVYTQVHGHELLYSCVLWVIFVQAMKRKINLLHSNALAQCKQIHTCVCVSAHTHTHRQTDTHTLVREIRTAFSVKRLNILSKYPKENSCCQSVFQPLVHFSNIYK